MNKVLMQDFRLQKNGQTPDLNETTSYREIAYLEDSVIPRTVYMEIDTITRSRK